MSSRVRLSACVCALLRRLKFSAVFLRHLVVCYPLTTRQNLTEMPQVNPSEGGRLNARRVCKYSDFGHLEGYISETVQHMMYMTNSKSHDMRFRLVPNR